MFKVNKKAPERRLTLFWCFYYQFRTYFTPFSPVFIDDFEQVILTGSNFSLTHLRSMFPFYTP